MKDDLYTIGEAANYLELPVKIIRSMEKDGRLTVTKEKRVYTYRHLFAKQMLDDYLKKQLKQKAQNKEPDYYLSQITHSAEELNFKAYGLDNTARQIKNAFDQDSSQNIFIIGPDHSGRLTAARHAAEYDSKRIYYILNDYIELEEKSNFSVYLSEISDELKQYKKHYGKEPVLIINEIDRRISFSKQFNYFIQVILKMPNVHLIGITTNAEYKAFIKPYLPVDMLNSILKLHSNNLDMKDTVQLLKDHAVRDHVYVENSDKLFKELYNITANSKTQLYTTQPYASLNIYWQLVAWHRARKYPIDQDLMHKLTARY